MRIHCRKCGKEYRVNERYVTEKGVRAKCRQCGAVLLIRMRRKGPSLQEEEKDAPLTPRLTEKPQIGRSSSSSLYRYCIFCGRSLEQEVTEGRRPVCSACEATGETSEKIRDLLPPTRSSRLLWYAVVVTILLVSAFMGYRFALS
jgi:DNA-directed RNA polymerase subunit RPC12/RpoP